VPTSSVWGSFLNNDTLALAEQLGARVDLTTEPGEPSAVLFQAGIHIMGSLPDYTMVPRVPFRPSIEDFRYPGEECNPFDMDASVERNRRRPLCDVPATSPVVAGGILKLAPSPHRP
jgi:hypothetical protein